MSRNLNRHAPDLISLAVLLSAIALLVWNRVAFDIWIARHDNLTAYLPWYTLLGERLRAGEIPGWNPYQFSGTPFAGDPQSGWMYLPAMIPFTLFAPTTAIWVKLAMELVVAGLATYALIRVLAYSPLAALAGSALYVFGPLSFQTAYCCTVRSHVGAWLPLALLGVELALRARSRLNQFAAIAIGGFGFSQILAGWLGQGALNASLIIGAFALTRALGLASASRSPRHRLRNAVTGLGVALSVGLFGSALNAAALWPRIVVNAESNLSAARYADIAIGYEYPPYAFADLVRALISDAFVDRRMTIPAAGLVLVLIAVIGTPRAPAVRFSAFLTVTAGLLSMSLPPAYQVASLVPLWQELHDHYPAQVTAGVMIGPAILAAAAIDALRRLIPRRRLTLCLGFALAVLGAGALWVKEQPGFDEGLGAPLWVGAGAFLLLVLLLVRSDRRIANGAAVTLTAMILLEPAGLEMIGSVSGWDPVPGWEEQWSPDSALAQAVEVNTSSTDAGGAGAFLQQQLAENGPFRFAGYGGLTWPGQPQATIPYAVRRAQPEIAAMLVNGQSIFLHLYDMQGYNPIQLSRYTDYILALNTVPQDYHLANLRPQGIDSPLLDALNVRYILVDARIPPDREDVVALSDGRPPVFQTSLVRVYENPTVLPNAWLVHEVISTTREEAIALLTDRDFGPAQTAVVETDDIPIAPPLDPSTEQAQIVRYEPERIEIQATANTHGLLVVSEIVASGWTATVDGRSVQIIPANIALRGIWLEPGTHTIVLTYAPSSLMFGLIISVLAHGIFIALLGICAAHWFRSRRSITNQPATTIPA